MKSRFDCLLFAERVGECAASLRDSFQIKSKSAVCLRHGMFPCTMCIPMCVHICPEADHLCYLIFVSDLWHGHLRSSSAHLRMNSYTQLSHWLAFSIALRTTASCLCTSDSGAAAGYVVHNYQNRRSVVVSVATVDHDQSGYSSSY